MTTKNTIHWNELESAIGGDLLIDQTTRTMYATDASLYYIYPLAVVFPKNKEDVVQTIHFANKYQISITARTAGTSLAGQAIGNGIILDMSRYMNRIIELNANQKWVDVEPGVNLSYLNSELKKYHLQFGPETSTSSRCCIGGMVGNNSCGLHSLVVGSVRDHLISAKWILSSGKTIHLKELSKVEFEAKKNEAPTLESNIYKDLDQIIESSNFQAEVQQHYPVPTLKRRNMGYALDQISYIEEGQTKFNLCKLIAGAEGTLGIGVSFRLNLIPLFPQFKQIITISFQDLYQALNANIEILTLAPVAIELMDHHIIEAVSKLNKYELAYYFNRQSKAVLIVEIAENNIETLNLKAEELKQKIQTKYNQPNISQFKTKEDISIIWQIRKDGLGVLANLKSKKKSVTVIEDTAVLPSVLPDYIRAFNQILKQNNLECVHYAHIATGELHLRPILDLEAPSDKEKFIILSKEIALLVKKYRGSLSGEHGDGRLRSPFLSLMYSDQIINWFKQVKQSFDPNNLFNPDIILNDKLITQNLKYNLTPPLPNLKTIYRFDNAINIHDEVDKCTGSGICIRKDHNYSGMCPTYHATDDETFSTRGRANLLRKTIRTNHKDWNTDSPGLKRVLEQCLGCKACKLECPSSVDIAKLKSEFLAHYYETHRPSLRTLLVAYLPRLSRYGSIFPQVSNWISQSYRFKKLFDISKSSNIPIFSHKNTRSLLNRKPPRDYDVILYIDEFTNYFDSSLGYKTVLLLEQLGVKVYPLFLSESGRTYISKGLLHQAKKIANKNAQTIYHLNKNKSTIVGIEPSTLSVLIDENKDLVDQPSKYEIFTKQMMLVDRFILQRLQENPNLKKQLKVNNNHIFYHGHCHQKASFGIKETLSLLKLTTTHSVTMSKTGCCGMAGSFGYEEEHSQLAVAVGEKALFPAVRKQPDHTIFLASGTSCRYHITRQTSKVVLHPIEYLYSLLAK
ncbi:FAD-binding and (Fe-S)-binding domain-containing protein [Prolixibacteraceae bacterium]|nr:FAD-binding and (Fe-S)-binding domain-containing protein [Prolixibacteraceae bacterium]